MLSQSQVNQYETDGFLVVDDVFTPQEVAALRAAAESPEVAGEVAREGGEKKTVHLLGLTARHPLFLALAADKRLTSLLAPLLGPDIQLQHSKLAAQATTKGAGGFGWHQDFAFFPHTNTSLAAVMVMLDDATPQNGCMRMLCGSQTLGPRDHTRGGYFVGACQETALWEDGAGQIASVTPRAGGVSIHHCLTLHGSGPNISGAPRRGVVLQYRAADAYQLADTVWPDTGLQVAGQARGAVRCEPGAWRLPQSAAGYVGAGPSSARHQEGEFARQQNEAASRS